MKKSLLALTSSLLLLSGCNSGETKADTKKEKPKPENIDIVVKRGSSYGEYNESDIKDWYTMKGVLTVELKNGRKVKSSNYFIEYGGEDK